jgi:hypothetical protein
MTSKLEESVFGSVLKRSLNFARGQASVVSLPARPI